MMTIIAELGGFTRDVRPLVLGNKTNVKLLRKDKFDGTIIIQLTSHNNVFNELQLHMSGTTPGLTQITICGLVES